VATREERAQASEDARVFLRESEQLLHEQGLFRYHRPKRFDGMEFPFLAVVDVVAELMRGCPPPSGMSATSAATIGRWPQAGAGKLCCPGCGLLIENEIAVETEPLLADVELKLN
jgi:alkylation response protein AidB-like acyl-CoA dehydrogenase